MINEFELETRFGPVKATWRRVGRMIEVRYGDRTRKAQASPNSATDLFVAKDITRGWIADDLQMEGQEIDRMLALLD